MVDDDAVLCHKPFNPSQSVAEPSLERTMSHGESLAVIRTGTVCQRIRRSVNPVASQVPSDKWSSELYAFSTKMTTPLPKRQDR
jgi:hypothetical protein